MNIATIGIDLTKNVFQLHGVDGHGKVTLRRQIHRGQMRGLFVNLAPCLIGMEACASARTTGPFRLHEADNPAEAPVAQADSR